MGGDRAVVDDAPAPRPLPAHDAEGLARAQEAAGEIGGDHAPPFLHLELVDGGGPGADAGIVEQHIEASEGRENTLEEVVDRGLVPDVGGQREAAPRRRLGEGRRLLQRLGRRPASATR